MDKRLDEIRVNIKRASVVNSIAKKKTTKSRQSKLPYVKRPTHRYNLRVKVDKSESYQEAEEKASGVLTAWFQTLKDKHEDIMLHSWFSASPSSEIISHKKIPSNQKELKVYFNKLFLKKEGGISTSMFASHTFAIPTTSQAQWRPGSWTRRVSCG